MATEESYKLHEVVDLVSRPQSDRISVEGAEGLC